MRRLRNTLILLFSVLLALAAGALYFGSCVSNSTTNLPNVFIKGINVSGLDQEKTAARLKAQGWEEETSTPLTVTLPAGVSFSVDRLEAGAVLSARKMAEAAFAYGHTGHWLADLSSYLKSMANPVDRGDAAAELNDAFIAERIRAALDCFTAVTESAEGYSVDKENAVLVMHKGAGELQLNGEKLTQAVRNALLAGETTLDFRELEGNPGVPDFAAIYQALAVEPVNAHYVEGGWDVVDEVVGCSFDVAQANALWSAAGWMDEVRIPLTITYPEVTGESLRAALFRDLLGSQTTYFPYSVPNRVSNIQLAASKIDGTILNPGEVFSYNETIGQRTLEAGFLMAGAYSNGEVVEELGGGICQVSSTLYCAVLYSQLGLKSRDSHYFKVDYLDWGLDATVSWPTPDFKFINSRNYPIRINAYADPDERYIRIEIWGTDEDGTYVELTHDRYTIYDDTYPEVAIGWNVYLYAKIYDAQGNLLRTEDRPVSTYHKHAEDILWPPEKLAADAAAGAAAVTFG